MKDEALRLALEALEFDGFTPEDATHRSYHAKAITAIKQALAQEKALQALHNENERLGLYKDAYGQPEPKPFGYFRYDLRLDAWVQNRAGLTGTPFYTSPPKREWQGLTDEEKQDGNCKKCKDGCPACDARRQSNVLP